MAYSTGTLSALNSVLADLSMPNPLGETHLVDFAPAVMAQACAAAGEGGDDIVRAVRLHDFVRDRIDFGFGTQGPNTRASQVLEDGIGSSIPKAHLFVALLRCAGIPARLRFVAVDAGLLYGLVRSARGHVDHAVTEVWLEDRWVLTDSYVIDADYFGAAIARLRAEGRSWGYGVHVDGRVEWSGRAASFSQLVTGGPDALPPAIDLGVHADAAALYAAGRENANPPGWSERLVSGMVARGINRRIQGLRVQT